MLEHTINSNHDAVTQVRRHMFDPELCPSTGANRRQNVSKVRFREHEHGGSLRFAIDGQLPFPCSQHSAAHHKSAGDCDGGIIIRARDLGPQQEFRALLLQSVFRTGYAQRGRRRGLLRVSWCPGMRNFWPRARGHSEEMATPPLSFRENSFVEQFLESADGWTFDCSTLCRMPPAC